MNKHKVHEAVHFCLQQIFGTFNKFMNELQESLAGAQGELAELNLSEDQKNELSLHLIDADEIFQRSEQRTAYAKQNIRDKLQSLDEDEELMVRWKVYQILTVLHAEEETIKSLFSDTKI